MDEIKAIIFDMDGVLIESKDWHYEALNRALELFGMQINDVVQICTLVYLGLQGVYLLWKWIREACKDE